MNLPDLLSSKSRFLVTPADLRPEYAATLKQASSGAVHDQAGPGPLLFPPTETGNSGTLQVCGGL